MVNVIERRPGARSHLRRSGSTALPSKQTGTRYSWVMASSAVADPLVGGVLTQAFIAAERDTNAAGSQVRFMVTPRLSRSTPGLPGLPETCAGRHRVGTPA